MHSSISSFEAAARLTRAPSAERLTAADRPGVAQPVPERPVPQKPWGRILLPVVLVVFCATLAWEWRMRSLEVLPADYEDGPALWAEQRRRVDTENIRIAIVSDSRMLFDTDLDRFEALTGVRPLQLGLAGTNARPFLENLAEDPDFKGLVLVGIAETSYFRERIGLNAGALDRYKFESPAQRSSLVVNQWLSRRIGFLDDAYRLSLLVARLDRGTRRGADTPYNVPWKLKTTAEDRGSALWPRIEHDVRLNTHARAVWALNRQPITDEVIAMTQQRTIDAVKKIRARGGEVIFVRPPSAGDVWASEQVRIPRTRGWDPLLQAASVVGLHYEDDPVARGLFPPELSHLSRACSAVYTDSYVRELARLTKRVQLRVDAPPPLTPHDCPDGRMEVDKVAAANAN